MSTILDQCKSHTTSEISKSLENNLVNYSSIYFLYIDKNKSNFNNLSVEIARFSQQFSFIGLAETNVGSDAGSVYMIPGYKPFYQDTYNNKKKGTGVALYVNDNFNAIVDETISIVTENLETIFVTVKDKTNSMTIGAIYRPPSADFSKSLEELAYILQQLPKNVPI